MGKASRRKSQQRLAVERALAHAESRHAGLRELPLARNFKGPATSVVLWELIQPYAEEATSLEKYRKLVAFGEVAWNWAVEPDLYPHERIKDIFRQAGMSSDDLDGAYQALNELKERKMRLFPEDRRLIVNTEVHVQDDGSYYLAAAAVAYEEPAG